MKRSSRLAMLALIVSLACALLPAGLAGASDLDALEVTISPTSSNVVLGENLTLEVSVANTTGEPTVPVVVHLDVTNPSGSGSVDPEDWTSTLSKTIGEIAPGETKTVSWEIQPISPGSFAVYAVALSSQSSTLSASNVLTVHVEDQRSLNPGGILPVAIGAPVLVGGLLANQLQRGRRGGSAMN